MNSKDNTSVSSYKVKLQSEGSPERVFNLAPGSLFTVPIKEKNNYVLKKIKDQYGDIYTPGQNIVINYDLTLTYQWKLEETPAIYFETKPSDMGLEITHYKGKSSKVVIPEIIEGEKITAIGPWAFKSCIGPTEITIPDCVTSIGNHAFEDCSGLTSIDIPESVTSIGLNTFEGWTSSQTINICKTKEEVQELIDSGRWSNNWNYNCNAHIVYGYEPSP